MKKALVILPLILAALAVVLGQRRQAARMADRIASMRTETARLALETGRLREHAEQASADIVRRQEQLVLERAVRTNTFPAAKTPPTASLSALPATRPEEFYWSEASDRVWVPKEVLSRLDIRAIGLSGSNEWQLTDQVITALLMNGAERAATERTLSDYAQQFHELERAHFSEAPAVESTNGLKIQFRMTPFREEAAEARQRFAASVGEILGEERAERFLRFAGQRMDNSFNAFGDRERSILFDYVRNSESNWTVRITETSSRGGSSQTTEKCSGISSYSLVPTNIPPYWRRLIQFRPPPPAQAK